MLLYSRVPTLILGTAAAILIGSAVTNANPLGAQVVGGSATVSGQGSATVTVKQGSERAILNWRSFDIGRGETTRFVQPNSGSIALNRVTGGEGPSQIFGTLTANGRIFLVNPDGVLFDRNAAVDTAGFLATTNDIRNDDFMAGRYTFTKPGRSDASIVNLGSITARDEGFAALVAPGVRNAGTITAKLGKVALASGNRFTLDFYGDKLISLAVDDQVAGAVKDVATGKTLRSLVKNEGTIRADGGRVELSAVAARKVVDSVINNTGVVEANSVSRHNGMIVLGAATRASKPAKAPVQTVKVSGKLSAAGNKDGETGGKVEITGEQVTLAGASIDVSGADGGGTLLIGGDWSGGHPAPGLVTNPSAMLESNAVPTATMTTVDAASTLDASATMAGNGGKVIVWADQTTSFAGTITARGGASSGDGGFVETSGHQTLAFTGTVDTLAPNGAAGTLLLDPQDVTISKAGPITAASIEAALTNGDVVVTTGSGQGNGDITVAQSITWSNNSSLTLDAFRNIVIDNGVAIANTGTGNLTLRADSTGTGNGTISFLGTGKVDFSKSTGYLSFIYDALLQSGQSRYALTNPAVTNQLDQPNQLNLYPLDPTAPMLGTAVPVNDDGWALYNITSVFPHGLNFGGINYTSIWINTNGSVSFAGPISTFTPTLITPNSPAMIAPFWADVDTRAGSPIRVNFDPLNQVVTVNWNNVGYFDEHTDPTNSFQLALGNRGNGNFDVLFHYSSIGWTAGDANGGVGGLGGTPARAGFTYGTGNATKQFELPQSGNQAALLNLPDTPGNTGMDGTWYFAFQNGQPVNPSGQSVPNNLAEYSNVSSIAVIPNQASQTQNVLPTFSFSNFQQQGGGGGNHSTTGGIGGVPHVSGLPPPGETRFLPNQLVVQIGPSISPQRLAAVARRLGLRIAASQSLGLTGTTIVRFTITNGRSVVSLIKALARLGIYSQPNYVFGLAQGGPPATAQPTGGPEQYAVQKLKLDATHRLANGDHVLVAVIDSEIDAAHPDIAGAIAARFDAVGKPGKPHFHGTGIAGAIVAHHTLIGVAPDVKILAVRAFSADGKTAQGTTFQIVKALNWAVSKGARIINMSFAGPRDPSLEKAFEVAHAKGVVLIAAAGNAGPKSAPLYPGADPDVIAVTAIDAHDKVFSGANRGKYILAAAPGVDVIAPAPADSYQLMTGTSVAAAEVTGVVALLLQHHPKLTPDWIRKALTESAKHLGSAAENPVYGAGLVDPVAALKWVDTHPQPARPAHTSFRETPSSRRKAPM